MTGTASTPKPDVAQALQSSSPSGVIASVYHTEWGRIVATLMQLVGDFALAEETAQEAFASAMPCKPRLPFGNCEANAALYCQATRAESTDWVQIVHLYEVLERLQPSPILTLNRAVAIAFGNSEAPAMADSPQALLGLIDNLAPELDSYHLFPPLVWIYSGMLEH